jgi:magnesium-transporting ATPase (P-type)
MSFEPHELDVMHRPPRAVDRPLLTPFALWRILIVSLGLMAFTLLAFFWMKSQGVSDDLARTVAVNALVIGQAFYALNSRYLLDSSVSIQAHRDNPYLPYSYGLLVVLQLLFTYAPPLQVLFDTEAVPLWTWLWLLLGGLVFFFLVEGEKLVLRRLRAARDVPVTADSRPSAATPRV